MMLTAQWSTWSGPGRIAISPAPAGTPRGYRRLGALFLRSPASPAAIRSHLASLDPGEVWRECHRLVYPSEPVLMGSAEPGAGSYRDAVARWLTFWGYPVAELHHPEKHRPKRVHPRAWINASARL